MQNLARREAQPVATLFVERREMVLDITLVLGRKILGEAPRQTLTCVKSAAFSWGDWLDLRGDSGGAIPRKLIH